MMGTNQLCEIRLLESLDESLKEFRRDVSLHLFALESFVDDFVDDFLCPDAKLHTELGQM